MRRLQRKFTHHASNSWHLREKRTAQQIVAAHEACRMLHLTIKTSFKTRKVGREQVIVGSCVGCSSIIPVIPHSMVRTHAEEHRGVRVHTRSCFQACPLPGPARHVRGLCADHSRNEVFAPTKGLNAALPTRIVSSHTANHSMCEFTC